MDTVEAMLETYPKDLGDVDRGRLTACIQGCYECSQACTACADACLSEDMVADLTKRFRWVSYCTEPPTLSRYLG